MPSLTTSTPEPIPTSVTPEPVIPKDDTITIVAAVCVPLIVLILLVAGAVIVGIYFTRKRYPNCKEYFHGHSDTELGKWQNVVGESGAEFVCAEQEDDYRNHKENNHVSTAIDVTEPRKCEEYLANPLYNTSNAAQQEYMTECLYDQVTKEDLGQDADEIDFSDYTDAQSMPPPPSSSGGNAPVHEEKRVKEELGQFKPVYSDVNKSTPVVPQKSNDLLKYLATRVPATNAPPPPPAKKKSPTAHPALSRISDNPVYQGTEAALSLQNRMDSSTGEEMYNQPVVHLTTPRNNSEPNIHRGFTVKEELAPQPSAPPLYPESHGGDGIYSEPIKPSDFAFDSEHEKGEVEGQPHVYAPVYAVPAMLPEGFQQPVEITSDNIVEKKELGVGQFGKVVLAATNGLSLKDMQISKTDDNRDISILVAVKKLMLHPSQAEREMFEKEVKFMSCLKHQNVVRLIGVCYNDPAFIMMEYMEEGDLSQFLQRYSEIVSIITCANNTSQITTSTLVFIASQIASAMKYLAAHNYIHRDLATRNCLVGGNFTIKLADFGMSRNLYESHYYRIQGNAILPIRWMATECFFGIFSEKTDVWAFGVTMWELFTLAKEDPYSSLTDTEVVDDAIKGVYRQLLSRPAVCPKSLYKIMKQCWVIDPKQRASFQDVEEMLQTFWYMPNATL